MSERTLLWLGLGLGGAFLIAGGGVMVWAVAEDQKRWADALGSAFKRVGLPAEWGVGLGLTETNLRPTTNRTGADGARGGAWGPTQITARTASAFGISSADLPRMNTDPDFAADVTARMVKAGFAERDGAALYYGPPDSPEQMGAVWNAGFAWGDPSLPSSTRDTYVPRLLSNIEAIS